MPTTAGYRSGVLPRGLGRVLAGVPHRPGLGRGSSSRAAVVLPPPDGLRMNAQDLVETLLQFPK